MAGSLARAAPPRVAPRATPAPSAARRSRRSAQAPTSSSTSLRARAKAGGDDAGGNDADGATSRAEDAQLWIDAWRQTLRDATTASASEASAKGESNALSETARVSSAVNETSSPSSRRANADVAKAALMRAARLTDRGLRVGGADARAALNERVSALEATRGDDDVAASLIGAWRLVYTDALETLAALRVADATPGVTAGLLTQTIAKKEPTVMPSSDDLVATTRLEVSAPLLKTSAFVSAELTFVSPRRKKTRVVEFGIEDGELVDTVSQYVSAPVSVRILGTDVDTSAIASAADPAQKFVKNAVSFLGDSFASAQKTLGAETVAAPVPFSFPGAQAWMLTTYVDTDTRVARTEGGSVYLFERIRGYGEPYDDGK